MSRRFLLSICLIGVFSLSTQAQQFTISGTIQDASSGEELIGASIAVRQLKTVGVVSNEYGFYSLTLPKGSYTLEYSYIGFETKTVQILLDKNQKIDVSLPFGSLLEEIIVSAEKGDEQVTGTQMGLERLNIQEIAKLPVLFGEKDVLKTIQLLPGVKSAGEGSSGFNVRGGGTDQNLILLDEAPVYNASHLLGFFSTFNSEAIKDATLIKGNSPAQYGGRLASVLDVRMREGNAKHYEVAGGLGLISSRLSVEGPISKDKSSFLVTARRTYADVFLKATPDFKDNTLYFYDLNTKINYRINENNRIYISGYFGRDVLGLGDQFGIDWGNKTGTLRWNSILNPKLFSNTSLIYSDYDYQINLSGNGTTFSIKSQIQDWNFKQEFSFYPNTKNSWRFGFNAIHHTLKPSRFQINEESTASTRNRQDRTALENALYASNTFSVNSRLNIEYGIRLSAYSILGGDTYNIYKENILIDSVVLPSTSIGKTYVNPEPRLSLSYTLNPKTSVKLGYARNTQNLHLLSNSTSTSPTDQWIGNSYNIKPEIADQLSVGLFRNFADNAFEFSIETYYKNMQNQVDYKNGADINTAPDVESELLFGSGRAYGVELYFKKNSGRLTGWISYTLSRTERQINPINEGNWYPAKQDRTHDLSIVGMYQLTPKWTLSSVFVFNTGNAVTFPSGKYTVNELTTFYYTSRNGYRMPDYHRLDLSATYESQRKGRFQSSWNFSVYNAYGRENAYTITFEDDPDDPTRTRAIQTALFKWVPSITYNFKF